MDSLCELQIKLHRTLRRRCPWIVVEKKERIGIGLQSELMSTTSAGRITSVDGKVDELVSFLMLS